MQGRGGGRGRGPGGFFDDRGPPGGGWNGREGGGGFPQDGPGFSGRGPEGGFMDMHGQDRGPFMQGECVLSGLCRDLRLALRAQMGTAGWDGRECLVGGQMGNCPSSPSVRISCRKYRIMLHVD